MRQVEIMTITAEDGVIPNDPPQFAVLHGFIRDETGVPVGIIETPDGGLDYRGVIVLRFTQPTQPHEIPVPQLQERINRLAAGRVPEPQGPGLPGLLDHVDAVILAALSGTASADDLAAQFAVLGEHVANFRQAVTL